MSNSPEDLYGVSDDERVRLPVRLHEERERRSRRSHIHEGGPSNDTRNHASTQIHRTANEETAGSSHEHEKVGESPDNEHDPPPYVDESDTPGDESSIEEQEQPRICTICFNLKLFVQVRDLSLQTVQTSNIVSVLKDQVKRDEIKSKCLLKVEFYDLLESARIGDCVYCQFLFNCLRTEAAEPAETKSTIVRVIATAGNPFYIYWEDKVKGCCNVEVYAEEGTSPCIPELGSATEIAPHSAGDGTFSQIREWLRECENNHLRCRPISSSSPRRLVDTGLPIPPHGARKIKLIQDKPGDVKYIALSHCWGQDQNFTTSKETLQSRLTEIAWNSLPKTYRDAITVARKLHVRYIWIDSLCIIQDDKDDWDVESAKMASIYEESYLTLAAALSPGDSHGFLGEDEYRLKYASRPVKGETTTRIRQTHDYRSIPSEDALSTRAWTMQERMIPPRLLTFSLGVNFQCRYSDRCECGSGLFPDLMSTDPDTWRRLDRATCRAALEGEVDPDKIYHFWLNGIVVPYSQRKLTKSSDRLPAISALAQKFQLKLDDTYLAGLWEKDLWCGLSWSSNTMDSYKRHDDISSQAPSWSWASVDGPVRFGYITEHSDRPRAPNLRLKIIGASVVPRGFNVTGEVEFGMLTAGGPCLECFLTLESQTIGAPYSLIPLRPGFQDAIITSGIRFDTALEQVEIPKDDFEGGETLSSLNRCNYESGDPIQGQVLCLLLYQLRNDREEIVREFLVLGRTRRIEGVLASALTEVGLTSDVNIYQRIGLLRMTTGYDSSSWFGELPEADVFII